MKSCLTRPLGGEGLSVVVDSGEGLSVVVMMEEGQLKRKLHGS